jgi:hypothetical protein
MRIPFLDKSRKGATLDLATPTVAPLMTSVPHSATANAHASLANIIGRRTPILWVEAVAIVEGLTRGIALIADDPRNAAVPDLADVFLTPEGRIELGSSHSAHAGVQSLARTLHVLVAGEQVPPSLRLFIAKWIETPEPHAVQEFGEALAYFARPDGAALIRTVYERFLAMPDLPAGAIVPKPNIEPPKQVSPRRRLIPSWVLVGAAALCFMAVFIAWALSRADADGKGSTVAGVIADGRRLLGSAGEQLAQRLGIGTSSAPAPVTLAEPTGTTPGVPQQRPRVSASASAPVAELPMTPIPQVRRSFDPGYVPFLITPSETQAAAPVATPPDDLTEPAAIELPSVVYTVTDTNVEPPQMVYPHLPRVSYTGPDVNSMEVIVALDGSVERVRLISAARRMTDMMLLSGAKSWRFAPALLDGQPVRYRITINWSATQ